MLFYTPMASRHSFKLQVLKPRHLLSVQQRPLFQNVGSAATTITKMATIATYRVPEVKNENMVRKRSIPFS